MELSFLRQHILNTTFTAPSGADRAGPLRPVYRITTTHHLMIFPEKTTIEYVGAEDEEKHRVVAQIIWNWPSQDRSYVLIGERLYTLNEFLRRGTGIMNTDSFITLGDETLMWKSTRLELQLYDSQGRHVVQYRRQPCWLGGDSNFFPMGYLNVCEEIANNWQARDIVFTSFFIYKFCRDVKFPWTKNHEAKPIETWFANDGRGEYVRLQNVA